MCVGARLTLIPWFPLLPSLLSPSPPALCLLLPACAAHHGMIFVPTGYSYGPALFDNSVVRVSSSGPQGAGYVCLCMQTTGGDIR